MNEKYVSPAVGSIVKVCCDNMAGYDWKGRLYTRYSQEPVLFCNAAELLAKLELFYDWLGFPEASTIDRSFREGKKPGRKPDSKERQVVVMSGEEMEKLHGDKATFVVRIQYRQNATWQGQVTWAEKNKTMNFRSALELLKLIDSTASEGFEDNWKE